MGLARGLGTAIDAIFTPRRARNTNSGNPVMANDTEAAIWVATNTVHHAEATPSCVEIPVLNP